MSNRLTILFERKRSNVLNIYCTAGYPQLNSTLEVMQELQDNGVDIIELGMPYSDPLADGPVIQQSNMTALENGMSIPLLFDQLKDMRRSIHVPVILMGYMNPVLQYGVERFCRVAAKAGVDGVILPDLPMHEFQTQYREHFEKNGLKFIFLVTPETSEERIRKIDELSSGFIYAVSSSSTTGSDAGAKAVEGQENYFKRLKGMGLTNPVMVGFGIKDSATFRAACKYSNGGIIGSAYINALKNSGDIQKATKEFINTVLG
jgi:tryptophan synthase alpha chain